MMPMKVQRIERTPVGQNPIRFWTNETGFVNGKIEIDNGNSFVAATASKGKTVTVKARVSGCESPDETDYEGVKAGVLFGVGTGGGLCFKVYTSDGSGANDAPAGPVAIG